MFWNTQYIYRTEHFESYVGGDKESAETVCESTFSIWVYGISPDRFTAGGDGLLRCAFVRRRMLYPRHGNSPWSMPSGRPADGFRSLCRGGHGQQVSWGEEFKFTVIMECVSAASIGASCSLRFAEPTALSPTGSRCSFFSNL
jgi:hypothetical protein